MATEITDSKAIEKSTYVITVAFKDEDGVAVTPDTMTWSLYHKDGTIVNSREDVAISPLATTADIVLSNLDLAISAPYATKPIEKRFLVLEGSYTSGFGPGLPLKDEVTFTILNTKVP